ncbi:hypothetical protein GCM10011363_33260 [Marivita lacus]|uniref:UPF0391 membrane protein GCM10011363_33260 n=2 Tax=Marivita lacus TaxID=1323742 RepID=A0ABQ1L2H8_9RHOB|nr:hypothetical protein GCM10011363_33260 [Marivita lacus]
MFVSFYLTPNAATGSKFLGTIGGNGGCSSSYSQQWKDLDMLYWAAIFLVIALIAAVFGFGGIASASAGIAQILFVVFLVLFIATLIMRAVRS